MKATTSPSPLALFPSSYFRRLRPFPSLRNPNPLPSRALSSSFSRRPRRHRLRRLRLPSVPSPTESSYPPDYQSLELSIPVDGVAGVVAGHASSAALRLLSAGADAFHDLRTSVRVDSGRRIVFSCRRSSLIFLAGALLSGLAVVVAARVLLWLVRPLGSGFGEREVVVRRRDRSLGGREVVVGRWEEEGRRKSLRRSVSPLELWRGDGVRVVRRNVVGGIRFAGKERLPKWWVEKSSLLAEGPVGGVDFQREADRLVRAIVDKRTSGMDYKDDDIIQLRQICKISGAKVSFGTINARDSFYRAAVAFVLHICSRVPDSASSVEIGGEVARQFICGLADNIGLENIRAARIVCAAVAAQTRSCFLQTWALEVQGKRFEALEVLLKICRILKTFPPEDGSVRRTKEAIDAYKVSWKKYGCTIMTDGWTDRRARSLINFIISSPDGSMFLKCIDASFKPHTAEFLYNELEKVMGYVGVENVVQVVTDNASNNVAMGNILMEKKKQIYWTPCAAYCVDLILEYVGKLKAIQATVTKARSVTGFLYKHTRLIDMMRKYIGGELARSGIAWFATQYLTLESLYKHKNGLRRMFMDTDWLESKWMNSIEGRRAHDLVMSIDFWKGVVNAIKAFQPFVRVLRVVEREDERPMALVHKAMLDACEALKANFKNDENEYNAILKVVDQRWENHMTHPLHKAGYFLNPSIFYSEMEKGEENILDYKMAFMDCVCVMVEDGRTQDLILTQLLAYMDARESFGRSQAIRQRTKLSALTWWDM